MSIDTGPVHPIAIRQSNYMTNVLPQAANMNRGVWLRTEQIVECFRDIYELLVIGGVVWGNNPSDDFFIRSHGLATPDAFWKVVVRGNGDAIAWIVPNSQKTTRVRLDSYLVTVRAIEDMIGERFPVNEDSRYQKRDTSWMIPRGCNKG